MAARKEQFKNNATTTLNGAVTNVATSITVLDGSAFPSSGNFRLIITNEILICTARSGNTLTVVRAQEGTSASAHDDGTTVTHILTAGSRERGGRDNDAYYNSSRPPLGLITDASGNTLALAGFTWDNQETATAADQNGTIFISAPAVLGEKMRVLYKSAPSPSYSCIACVRAFAPAVDSFPHAGFGFRQSSSGKLCVVALSIESSETGPKLAVYKYTSATVFSASAVTRRSLLGSPHELWIRLTDNNTNVIYEISGDGINWMQVFSESRTTFFTTSGPDQVAFYANALSDDHPMHATLLHMSFE